MRGLTPFGATFETVFEEAADPSVIIDARRAILAMNRAARDLFGESLPAGMTCRALFLCERGRGEGRMAKADCYGLACVRRRENMPHANVTMADRTGRRFPASISYTLLTDVPGGAMMMTIRDLTPHLRWLDGQLGHLREEAASEAREDLARDVHDGLGQTLITLRMMSRAVAQRMDEGDADEARRHAATLVDGIDRAVREMRRTVSGLRRPSAEGRIGDLVKEVVGAFGDPPGLALTVRDRAPGLAVQPKVRHDLSQIVREAVSNAVRHARASTVTVWISRRSDGAAVAVEDDGVGPGAFLVADDHFGLVFMEERARRIGADITILRNASGGTTVSLVLPLEALLDGPQGTGDLEAAQGVHP